MTATIVPETQATPASPQTYARIAGLLYLIIIVIGLLGETVVRGRIVAGGDPVTTAANLRASEFLWRGGIAAELLLLVCAVPMALLIYRLLQPVSRDLALLAAFFNMVSIAIEAACSLYLVGALLPLGNAGYLKGVEARELYTLAYLFIRTHEYGFGVSLIFFAGFCLVAGYLIVRSGYLPRFVGILMQLAGVSYLVNSYAMILSPSLASRLFPLILLPAFIGETSLCLWLLAKGVNVAKWMARVNAAPAQARFAEV